MTYYALYVNKSHNYGFIAVYDANWFNMSSDSVNFSSFSLCTQQKNDHESLPCEGDYSDCKYPSDDPFKWSLGHVPHLIYYRLTNL